MKWDYSNSLLTNCTFKNITDQATLAPLDWYSKLQQVYIPGNYTFSEKIEIKTSQHALKLRASGTRTENKEAWSRA